MSFTLNREIRVLKLLRCTSTSCMTVVRVSGLCADVQKLSTYGSCGGKEEYKMMLVDSFSYLTIKFCWKKDAIKNGI